MKRVLPALIILCLLFAGTACAESTQNVNYADRGNWANFAEGEGKVADVFLIYPTVDMNDE